MTSLSSADLTAAVDPGRLMRHVEEFARRIKLSGSVEERAWFRYLQAQLDEIG